MAAGVTHRPLPPRFQVVTVIWTFGWQRDLDAQPRHAMHDCRCTAIDATAASVTIILPFAGTRQWKAKQTIQLLLRGQVLIG